MEGVLLAHWEHDFLDSTSKIINESPFGVCDVTFRAIVWAPQLGQRLCECLPASRARCEELMGPDGSHSISSPSHISLLYAKTFNISIPLQHIPLDDYVFEHTDEADTSDREDTLIAPQTNGHIEETGRWRHTSTGRVLGDSSRGVKFTVIGWVTSSGCCTALTSRMQVTNQMLSLVGSLLADPTNPPPPPEHARDVSPAASDDMVDFESSPPPETPEPAPQPRRKRPRNELAKQPEDVPDIVPQVESAADPGAMDIVDERFLSAREVKALHKEKKRRRREERKARKEERGLEAAEVVGAEKMVRLDPGEKERKRKRKSGAEREKQR